MNRERLKDVVVIYHANCNDGFGAAYAAWKKFGDQASYLPRHIKDRNQLPDGLAGKEIYILDYNYPASLMVKLRERNHKAIIIDHHASEQADILSLEGNVYDDKHSGAVLAWQYFHPTEPVPRLLLYIEDHDLWRCELPHNREFGAALSQYERDFETWDRLNHNLDDRVHFNKFISQGEVIARFEDKLVERILDFRERALFEDYEIYVLNAERIYRSILGNRLARLNEKEGRSPLAIIYYRYGGSVHCSLRGRGEVNTHEIAGRYGGGGHKHAASFDVPDFSDLPFKFL